MFDREQFKTEIAAKLKDVPREKRVAFAVRSAMRVLQLLAKKKAKKSLIWQRKEVFWFWRAEVRDKHLLGLLRAYSSTIQYVLTKKYADAAAVADADDAADEANLANEGYDAHAYAVYAVYAAYAAAYADAPAYAVDYAAAADAAAYSAYAADAVAIIQEIKHDLVILKNMTAEELLRQPLWSKPLPEDWQQLLSDFKADALSLNAGFEVWLNWYDDRLQGKPVDVDLLKQWNNIPKEIEEQGAAAVNAYLGNLVQKTATQPLNRVRAIFIGYGEAGKTSLIRVLHNEPVVEGKEDMTAGIAIRDWSVPDTDIKAHFWDFGGQVMAHATHQFFLRSSCLYVLVLNARSEINSTEQAEYWLEHVKSFGKDAPVMIVGNKAEKLAINLDMSYLQSKYPNIVSFYPVSCTQAQTHKKAEFDRFQRDFCQQLREVGTHQMLFTKEQFGVLETLCRFSPQAAFLPQQKFIDICTEHGIGMEGVQNRDWLLDILDKLGVVIHFPQLAYLDEYVLNPRWLTHGVYTLMYKQQARLSLKDAVAVLRDKPISDENGYVLDYPSDKCRFVLDAMQQFKLCYPLPCDCNTLIIPELLPTDSPREIPFAKTGGLAFEFVFRGFLPRHIMPELIVNRHEEIVNQIVWQRGVLLQHRAFKAQALLQVDYHERVLTIWVQGLDAKDYLSVLNDEVLKILGRLDLDYEERVELPISAVINPQPGTFVYFEKADYRQLLNSVSNGMYTFSGKYNIYDLKKVLGIILPEAEIKNISTFYNFAAGVSGNSFSVQDLTTGNKTMTNITQNINNSTVGSVIAAEKIEHSFNSLQDSKAEDAVKNLLEQLLSEINVLNEKVPASQELSDIVESTETLINESKRDKPRKEWYEVSLKGIKEAAKAVGDIANPVWTVAEKLSPLLLLS